MLLSKGMRMFPSPSSPRPAPTRRGFAPNSCQTAVNSASPQAPCLLCRVCGTRYVGMAGRRLQHKQDLVLGREEASLWTRVWCILCGRLDAYETKETSFWITLQPVQGQPPVFGEQGNAVIQLRDLSKESPEPEAPEGKEDVHGYEFPLH